MDIYLQVPYASKLEPLTNNKELIFHRSGDLVGVFFRTINVDDKVLVIEHTLSVGEDKDVATTNIAMKRTALFVCALVSCDVSR